MPDLAGALPPPASGKLTLVSGSPLVRLVTRRPLFGCVCIAIGGIEEENPVPEVADPAAAAGRRIALGRGSESSIALQQKG